MDLESWVTNHGSEPVAVQSPSIRIATESAPIPTVSIRKHFEQGPRAPQCCGGCGYQSDDEAGRCLESENQNTLYEQHVTEADSGETELPLDTKTQHRYEDGYHHGYQVGPSLESQSPPSTQHATASGPNDTGLPPYTYKAVSPYTQEVMHHLQSINKSHANRNSFATIGRQRTDPLRP
jgi:hypothetical protein